MTQQTNRLFVTLTIIPRNCTKVDTTISIESAACLFDKNGIDKSFNIYYQAIYDFFSKKQNTKSPISIELE